MLYILAELIGPANLFGPLAEYRIELFVALFAIIATIPSIPGSLIFSSRATLALAGLIFCVAVSIAQSGWLGGVFYTGYGILPVVLGFILVALNCKTKRHLQLIILVLFLGCVFDIVNGALALRQDAPSPYIYVQGVAGGNLLPRIRGLEFLNDPNDFAQLLVSLLPLTFFFWREGKSFRNKFMIPSALGILLTGMYLTRSRGGTVALVATIVVAARRKIGTVPAMIGGGLLFITALALGASGGREVSSESGADRIELWAIGLNLVKTHFLFGVGLDRFWDFAPNTAHNSVVICAAELGVVGLIFWVMFILSTVRGAILLDREPQTEKQLEPTSYAQQIILAGNGGATMSATRPKRFNPAPFILETHPNAATMQMEEAATGSLTSYGASEPEAVKLPDAEIRRLARLLLYSLTGFLAAGWFLSRALSIWLFIYCGMMHVVLRLANSNGIAPQNDKLSFLFRWSAIIAVILLTIVSIIIRVSH